MKKVVSGFGGLSALGALAALLACSSNSKSTTGPDPDPAWDTTRTYLRTVTLNPIDTAAGADTLADYPLLVRLSGASDSTGADVLAGAGPGGARLRFFAADSVTLLPHEIEHWSSTHAAVWVRLPSVTVNAATTVLLFWGDTVPAAASGAVFDSAAGFEAVFHLAEASGDTVRDATINGYKGVPVGSAQLDTVTMDTVLLHPLNVNPDAGALIGNAKDFRGDSANFSQGGGFRLVTAVDSATNNSFDYVGPAVAFSVSAWVRVNALPASNALRRGIVTKADSGAFQVNPNLQWHLRTLNDEGGGFGFLRTSVAPTGNLMAARSNAVNEWTFVTFSTSTEGRTLRAYNALGPVTSSTAAAENGVHTEASVFIGAFAGAAGNGAQFFNGFIDEVRISNVTRSNAWHDLDFATQRHGADAVSLGDTHATEHVVQIE